MFVSVAELDLRVKCSSQAAWATLFASNWTNSMLSIFLQLPFAAAVCTNAEQVAKFPGLNLSNEYSFIFHKQMIHSWNHTKLHLRTFETMLGAQIILKKLHWRGGKHKRCCKNWWVSCKIFLKNFTTFLGFPVFINFNGWMHKCCWNLGASALS